MARFNIKPAVEVKTNVMVVAGDELRWTLLTKKPALGGLRAGGVEVRVERWANEVS
jgi:hypothetical protein